MAKVILDLYIEPSYPYQFNIDVNTAGGVDLEGDYSCYFYCESIGQLQFSVVGDRYELTISSTNTDKLLDNLEDYTVYVIKTADSVPEKLMSGRIHIDKKVRA